MMTPQADPSPPPSPEAIRRGRVKLVLLGAFFALPFVGSWLAWRYRWSPGQSGNYGELIAPRQVPETVLTDLRGAPQRLSTLRGKWVLLQFDASGCDAACERKLYFMRQVRLALGRDRGRIERVWVLTDARTPRPVLLDAIEGTRVWRDRDAVLAPAFPRQARLEDHIYVIDPLGNLMMRYARDPDPSRMVKDLAKLLKYSAIGRNGDVPGAGSPETA